MQLVNEHVVAEYVIEQTSIFLAWISQSVFPRRDHRRTGYVDHFGELGLGVSVAVSPIFESLSAGRPYPDEIVVDRCVAAVAEDGVEKSCIGVLVYGCFFVVDGGGECGCFHGFLSPFGWCCGVEDFLHEVLAFLCELPSPAWPVVSAGAVPVRTMDVSRSFQFDHATSQALRRVTVSETFRHLRQLFLCDWLFDGVKDHDHVDLWGAVH